VGGLKTCVLQKGLGLGFSDKNEDEKNISGWLLSWGAPIMAIFIVLQFKNYRQSQG